MFQSNMSKNTVDCNCMTNKMLIVMFSTNPAIGEKNYTNEVKKKKKKGQYFFLVFDRVRTCDLRLLV